MHPVTTFASYTTGRVHPACPETSDPPPPATATAFFPSVGLSRTVSVWDRYRRRQSIGLGIVQAIIGALCIVFNAVSLGFYDGLQTKSIGFVGHGFWIGMMVKYNPRLTLRITRFMDNYAIGCNGKHF